MSEVENKMLNGAQHDPELLRHLFNAFEALNRGYEEMHKLIMTHNKIIKDLQARINILEKKLDASE
jgi:predicted  nucleic acid-binding Zn-ribbon protein